jgi:galactose mutarotase-like enzyme
MSGAQSHSLQNTELAIIVIPEEGGRLASLRSLRSGVEFLTQSRRSGPYPQHGFNANFQDGPCAGIEECLPTVGRCSPQTQGGPAPDHGDFWQLAWDVVACSDNQLSLAASGFSRTLRFKKELSLDQNTLRVGYSVENTGTTAQSFLYACHPLFVISAGDRVLLPREIHELRLDYSRDNRLGQRDSIVQWPQTQSGIRLDITERPEAGTAEMFYTFRLDEGWCGIYRSTANQVLEISFDARRLPYLGLWLCYGGWPDNSAGPRQYAVALEPTTSGCNSLTEALQSDSAITFEPSEFYDWEILFSVKERRNLS